MVVRSRTSSRTISSPFLSAIISTIWRASSIVSMFSLLKLPQLADHSITDADRYSIGVSQRELRHPYLVIHCPIRLEVAPNQADGIGSPCLYRVDLPHAQHLTNLSELISHRPSCPPFQRQMPAV